MIHNFFDISRFFFGNRAFCMPSVSDKKGSRKKGLHYYSILIVPIIHQNVRNQVLFKGYLA